MYIRNKYKVFNMLLEHSNNKSNQTAEELKGIQTKIEIIGLKWYVLYFNEWTLPGVKGGDVKNTAFTGKF